MLEDSLRDTTRSPYRPATAIDAFKTAQIALLIPAQKAERSVVSWNRLWQIQYYDTDIQSVLRPGAESKWLSTVESELAEVDELAEADGLPPVNDRTRAEAIRVLKALNPQPIVPVIYADESAIVIHFKAPSARASVGIEIRNDGRGDCYSHIDGRNKSIHYGTSADIPDDFVRERLRALSSAK